MDKDFQKQFSPFQSDVLFLLIGTNPLPNYVSSLTLTADGATVFMLHTQKTFKVASTLKQLVTRVRPGLQVIPREIDDSDGDKITTKIDDIVRGLENPNLRVGLNYSGGTKSMSVHAYYKLHSEFTDGCFSYLDARTLSMVMKLGNNPVQRLRIGQELSIKLKDLLTLHNYELSSKEPPRKESPVPSLCQAIAEVCSSTVGFTQWNQWTSDMEKSSQLPLTSNYPALEPVFKCFAEMCEGVPSEEKIAQKLKMKSFKHCSLFFRSQWLEDLVLTKVSSIAPKLGLSECMAGVKLIRANSREFELDVIAISGYQLFAVSCIATKKKPAAKEHLFEIYTHARQVGGDEARIGLVCCYDNPVDLQNEINEEWDASGKISVFGMNDLLTLERKISDWIEAANR